MKPQMDLDFLHKVSELFIGNGAKTLTMDEIAREFGISKKTLYQKYANKEALLEDVLKYNLNNIIKKIAELDIKVENAIERMYCRDEHIEKAVESNNSLLIKQLIKYYPVIFNRHMLEFSDKFVAVLEHNVKRGREQGFYREDFDEKSYATIFFQAMMSYHSSPFINTAEISMEQFKTDVMDFYMNAITTEKGKEVLKKYNLK